VKNTKEHIRKLGLKNTGGNRTLGEKHYHHHGTHTPRQTVHDTLRRTGEKAQRSVSDSLHQFANNAAGDNTGL
jgi:hypothetical protein